MKKKARELAQKYKTPCHGIGDCEFEVYKAAMEMAEWMEEKLIEVCKICERKSIESGHVGCAFRSIDNTYCWRD